MRRGIYWVAVLAAAALLFGGVTVAVLGYAKTSGPDGAVRGYFAALARSDAAGALAYGDVPAGPHTLLTATVLREQQRIAPLRRISIVSTERTGSTAIVEVSYTVAFPGSPVVVRVDVPVHARNGDWRLNRVAVPTVLEAHAAVQRETIVGAGIPAGRTLLFPGALPIRLDTPYLQLNPLVDAVSFDTSATTPVAVIPSAAGRTAMAAAVRTNLQACLAGPPDETCPLPDDRYVPGSLQGTVTGSVGTAGVRLAPDDPVGALEYRGTVSVSGIYRRLNFHNRQVAGHGPVLVSVQAVAVAVEPLHVRWVTR